MNSITFLATMNIGERFAYAGRMTLIGMMTIFAALSILWAALALFRRVLERDKAPEQKKPVAPAPKAAPAPVAAPVKASNDGELVAAITAAVSMMLAEENGGRVPNFRVVSFRRSRGNTK